MEVKQSQHKGSMNAEATQPEHTDRDIDKSTEEHADRNSYKFIDEDTGERTLLTVEVK